MDENVLGVVIDLCSRTFLIKSNQGCEKYLKCEDTDQFMRVLKVCTDLLSEDEIKYDSIPPR